MAWQLGDYTTVEQVKIELGSSRSSDDSVIEGFIRQASRRIDAACHRHFYGTLLTRYYNPISDLMDYQTLLVSEDLAEVTEILLDDGTTIPDTEYVLIPTNNPPYHGIRLKRASSYYWDYTQNPENAVAITGIWGYVSGSMPPDIIQYAAVQIAKWLYARRNTMFEQVGTDSNYTVPTGLPSDIDVLLRTYKKRTVGATGGY